MFALAVHNYNNDVAELILKTSLMEETVGPAVIEDDILSGLGIDDVDPMTSREHLLLRYCSIPDEVLGKQLGLQVHTKGKNAPWKMNVLMHRIEAIRFLVQSFEYPISLTSPVTQEAMWTALRGDMPDVVKVFKEFGAELNWQESADTKQVSGSKNNLSKEDDEDEDANMDGDASPNSQSGPGANSAWNAPPSMAMSMFASLGGTWTPGLNTASGFGKNTADLINIMASTKQQVPNLTSVSVTSSGNDDDKVNSNDHMDQDNDDEDEEDASPANNANPRMLINPDDSNWNDFLQGKVQDKNAAKDFAFSWMEPRQNSPPETNIHSSANSLSGIAAVSTIGHSSRAANETGEPSRANDWVKVLGQKYEGDDEEEVDFGLMMFLGLGGEAPSPRRKSIVPPNRRASLLFGDRR
jgi:hypothetical protein